MSEKKMTKTEGKRRLPNARQWVLSAAIVFIQGGLKKKILREAVEYYQDCVAASEKGDVIL